MTSDLNRITNELRSCVFSLCFQKTIHEIEQPSRSTACRMTVENILAFGVNAKLISRCERDDWLSVLANVANLADVAQKYMGDA